MRVERHLLSTRGGTQWGTGWGAVETMEGTALRYWLRAFRKCFRESCLPFLQQGNSILETLEGWKQRTCCGEKSKKIRLSIRSFLQETTLKRAIMGCCKCQPSTLRGLSNFYKKKKNWHLGSLAVWGGHSKVKCFKTSIYQGYFNHDKKVQQKRIGNSHIIGSSFDFRLSLFDLNKLMFFHDQIT